MLFSDLHNFEFHHEILQACEYCKSYHFVAGVEFAIGPMTNEPPRLHHGTTSSGPESYWRSAYLSRPLNRDQCCSRERC